MNASSCSLVSAGRRMVLLGTGLGLFACLALSPGRAAPPSADLEQAARLSQEALATRDNTQRAQDFDRALALYTRMGPAQQVIQVGLRYREFLQWSNSRVPGLGDTLGRLQELDLQLGESYLALGHYRTAEKYLERAVAGVRGVAPLPPARKMAALTSLARSAEQRGDRTRADRFWREVEKFALDQLDRSHPDLTLPQQIECAWKLADSYRFRGEPARAIARLSGLLPLHDRMRDPAGKRDTLRRLAAHHAARGEYHEAEEHLREALAQDARSPAADPIIRAGLAEEMAEVLSRQGKTADAERWRDQAVRDCRAILEPSKRERPEAVRVVAAFWKLLALYHQTSQYSTALQLVEGQEKQWGAVLGGPMLKAQHGTLQVILGSFDSARVLLREAVAELERHSPPSYVDLPRAYNNLAIVEQAAGNLEQAEALAGKCRSLYRQLEWPDDLIAVEADNLLGTCSAQRGHYAEAIERFREGAARCERLGRAADPQHSRLLLNMALLYRSQGDPAEALRACRQARELYQRSAAADALALAVFDAAQASLCTAQGRIDEAHALLPGILDICRKHGIDSGPLVVTARHCQGLYHLARREFAAAGQAWRQVQELQEQEKNSLLLPRTLNYLALTAELQGEAAQAEALYRRARELQRDGQRAFPFTRFITLWRLAGLAERRGDRAEARRLLDEAVAVVEAVRLQTYGDVQQRATFFAQFEPGLEQLVDCYVQDGDVEAAFTAAARSRSRTLLDQLQLAGVDPGASLRGPRGEELRRQEEELHRQISGLRARAQFIPREDVEDTEARELLSALDQAERRYAEVWREVLNASPVYRNLSAEDPSRTVLSTLRHRVLGPKTLLLAYHVGRERSYLFLLGDSSIKPEVFPLSVPASVVEHLASRAAPPGEAPRIDGRGLSVKKGSHNELGPVLPAPVRVDGSVPLHRSLARALVEQYVHDILDPEVWSPRGLRLTPRKADPAGTSLGPDLLGKVLLPPAVRRRIRDLGPECLVVIPDGPLHRVPLEALLLETSPKRRFVLDELPPIVYAPSAAILALLAERPRPEANRPLSLLTVSDPAYPQGKGSLPRLPFTARESRRIQQFFDPSRVTALEGARATERAVRAAVAGKRVIHLAAHGLADEDFGNLFGALALTPPSSQGGGAVNDDGYLALHEIYTLPLQDCDLAVLSACVTNVGPERPLEAGVTLASGFLAAGARRVVASHWSVGDESTAALMEAFFAEVRATTERGERASYARALQKARVTVRNTDRWSAPFHWAPFVLIGPAE